MIPTPNNLAPCPYGCGTDVLITLTEHGRQMAVNATPDAAGNQAVWRTGTGAWRSRSLDGTDAMPLLSYEDPFKPHVATSPRCSATPRTTPLPGLASVIPFTRTRKGSRLPRPYRRAR